MRFIKSKKTTNQQWLQSSTSDQNVPKVGSKQTKPTVQKKNKQQSKIKEYQAQAGHAQFIKTKKEPYQSVPRQLYMSVQDQNSYKQVSRDGSIERRRGDTDDHNTEEFEQTQKDWINNGSHMDVQMALKAVNQKPLVLDDPFKMKDPILIEPDYQENMDEQTENFQSRYRTVNENYKSVGSMRSPTASHQKKQPQSEVSSSNENYQTKFEDYLNEQEPLKIDADFQFPQKISDEEVISTPNSMSSIDRMNTDGDQETIQNTRFYFEKNHVQSSNVQQMRLDSRGRVNVMTKRRVGSPQQPKDKLFGFQKQKNIHQQQSAFKKKGSLQTEVSKGFTQLNPIIQSKRQSKIKPQQIPVNSRSISPRTPHNVSGSPRRMPNENLTHTPVTSGQKTQHQFGSQKPPERVIPRLGSLDKGSMTGQVQKKNLRQLLNKESSMSPTRSQGDIEEDISEQAQNPSQNNWGSSVHHQIMKLTYNRSKNDNILQKDKNLSVSLHKVSKHQVDRSELEKPQKPNKSDRRQMNHTLNRLQLNSLLSQLPEVINEDVPKTQRNREGELSNRDSSSSVESNCTEERNFTPGQKQFKKFLKEQTADRKMLKLQIRSQTRQIESKQAKMIAEKPIGSRHVKQNSFIGSNRMSPTPQPIPIEIFSQTHSDDIKKPVDNLSNANYNSDYNISPEPELNENTQNLSGVLKMFYQNSLKKKEFQSFTKLQENQQKSNNNMDPPHQIYFENYNNNKLITMGAQQSQQSPRQQMQSQIQETISARKMRQLQMNYEEVDVDQIQPSRRKRVEENTDVVNVDEYRSTKVEDSLVSKPSKNHPRQGPKPHGKIASKAMVQKNSKTQLKDPTYIKKFSKLKATTSGKRITTTSRKELSFEEEDPDDEGNADAEELRDYSNPPSSEIGAQISKKPMFRSRQTKIDDLQLSARQSTQKKTLIIEKKSKPSSFNVKNVQPSSDEESPTEKINKMKQGIFQNKKRSNHNSSKNLNLEKAAAKKIRISINKQQNLDSFKDQKLKKNSSNFSLGPQPGKTAEKVKKRETRIKSLYATTTNTQDLSQDLSKINQELRKAKLSKNASQNLQIGLQTSSSARKIEMQERASMMAQNKISTMLTKNLSKSSLPDKPKTKLIIKGGKKQIASGEGRSLTTQLFDKLSSVLNKNKNDSVSPPLEQRQPAPQSLVKSKIQDIKNSSSKLTMAAQLQKYRADGAPSPKNIKSKKKVAFMHPKTTKNNQGPQDNSNVLGTISPVASVRSTQRNQLGVSNITGGAFHSNKKQVHTVKNSRLGSAGEVASRDDAQTAHFSSVKSQPKHFDFQHMIDVNDEISEEEEKSQESPDKKMNGTPSQRFFTNNMRVSFMEKISEFEETPSILLERSQPQVLDQKVHKQLSLTSTDLESKEESLILSKLPMNACSCNIQLGVEPLLSKKGCLNTMNWLKLAYKDDNYLHLSNYKLYNHFLIQSELSDTTQIEQDIQQDLERTFQQMEYFQQAEVKSSLRRILIAFSNYEQAVGYVQGMNFIAAVLLFHAGEVAAFWLLCALMDKYELKRVLQTGLPGLQAHEEQIENIGRQRLPELFKHFDDTFVTLNLFSTDWIISMFMNFIPIELSDIYLNLFFQKSWEVFYEVAICLLSYYEKDLIRMRDAGQIVGQIKQARLGCEHLLMLSSQQSIISSRRNKSIVPTLRGSNVVSDGQTENLESEFNRKNLNTNPFAIIDEQPENFRDNSFILNDSQSEIMGEGKGRSHSMMPSNFKAKRNDREDFMTQSYQQNPLFIKNMKMWQQIIDELKANIIIN